MNHPEKITSYQVLAREIASLEPLFGEKQWEEAAARMVSLASRLGDLPAASQRDRAVIEDALSELSTFIKQIHPLPADVSHLLSTEQ